MIKFEVITIFPEIFDSFKNEALIARAQKKELISINTHFLRDYADDAHRSVDDRPYGGGAGMVMMVEPIAKAVEKIKRQDSTQDKGSTFLGSWSKSICSNGRTLSNRTLKKTKVIVFSPKGKKFDQAMARKWNKLDQLIMVCGRYEGIDERVAQHIADEEISIGDYVLFGGEVPAMVVMEAVTRLIPGVVGKQSSIEDESFSNKGRMAELKKRLEHPHYTRPEVFDLNGKKARVPKVLLSGDHKKIEEWRKKHAK